MNGENVLGTAVKTLRLAHGYTLAQVSERSGISVSYLSDIEVGRTTPTIGTLSTLADTFGKGLYVEFYDAANNQLHVTAGEVELLSAIRAKNFKRALEIVASMMQA